MQDLIPLGLYELVTNHHPLPVEQLAARPASPHARRTYRQLAEEYLNWLERDPLQVDATVISNYRAEALISFPPAAVALRLRIVGELYDEAIAAGLLSANPARGVAPPSYGPDTGCAPPTREVAAARQPQCDSRHEAGRRELALCLLALETDVPPEAVAALTVGDLDAEGALHLPPSAGAGDRLQLPETVSAAIGDYLVGREVADDSPLFAARPAVETAHAGPT